jgi:hypothetical protein
MTEMELHVPDHALQQWAAGARAAASIAVSLSKTAFVSKTFAGKPEEITAAILTGQEIGLEPLSALRSIDIIQGTPAMRAHALRGLVQSRGHDVWVEKQTATEAIVCGQRKGSEHVQRSVWTIDRASRLGLTSKDNWKKQPEAMLVARATAEVCRLVASDVLLGLPYAIEELDDPPAEDVKPKTAKRKTPPVEVAPPEIEPVAEATTPEPEPVCRTRPRARALARDACHPWR